MKEDNSHQEDYIGLSTLKRLILDMLRVIFQFFNLIGRSIRRHLALVIICSILGLVIAYLLSRAEIERFRSEMIVYNTDLKRRDYNQIVSNLNQLTSGAYNAELARTLHMNPVQTKEIASINAIDIDGQPLEKDTSSRVMQLFRVAMRFRKPVNVAPYQKAILDYLNNNSFLGSMKQGDRRIYEEKLAFINSELARMDSLKVLYNQAMLNMRMPATFYNNAFDPASIYEQSRRLAEEKEGVQRWLNLQSQAIVLVDGMKTPMTTNLVSRKYTLLIGLVAGMLVGILLALLAEARRKLAV